MCSGVANKMIAVGSLRYVVYMTVAAATDHNRRPSLRRRRRPSRGWMPAASRLSCCGEPSSSRFTPSARVQLIHRLRATGCSALRTLVPSMQQVSGLQDTTHDVR